MVGIFPTNNLSTEREGLESSVHQSPTLEMISDQVSQVKLSATETYFCAVATINRKVRKIFLRTE